MKQDIIEITTRDRLLRGWENSMELTRDFENYAAEIQDDNDAVNLFARCAEEECRHAAQLREMLLQYQ